LRQAILEGNAETVCSFVQEENIDLARLNNKSFPLLTCLRKGPYGVDALNEWFATHADPHESIPILITRSSPALQLVNGEMGFLEGNFARFSRDKKIPREALPAFEYAYALSVHKSQGSEYDRVTLLVPDGSEAFGQEILYTAATRAKQEIVIYGKKKIIQEMLLKGSKKISGLKKCINSY